MTVGSLFKLVIVGAIALGAYNHFMAGSDQKFAPDVNSEIVEMQEGVRAKPVAVSTNYRCDGRKHCSEMTSCEEAEFFLANCPGVMMDGNNDGEPCESQWCSQ